MQTWDRFWKDHKFTKEPGKYMVELVPVFKKRKVRKILDFGCGAGRHMVYLTKKGFFVVGQDITSLGLDAAQKNLNSAGLENYILINHDVTRLPFQNNSFDAVISTSALHHNKLSDINRAINEVHRVLKNKGLFFVSLTSREEIKKGKRIERGTYVTLSGPEKGMVHHLFTEHEIKKSFCDFRVIKLTKPTAKERHWLLLAEKTLTSSR
ncbi:MAG: class I SAM-dependent methyltransferase [Candidatus Micrarchaeaceae archaeon]|jgi:ubiquinone/menaquinone biosynthesis C-methylase UbiE|nr:class I SAM-dependent methyltransferase [Candidatus Micrarchaeota archaeon]HII10078.1 class I SAM-dependent methyltransferase [Candidatus Micrarchaeota archaeon]